MSLDAPEVKMWQLVVLQDQLNDLSVSLNGRGKTVFDDLSLSKPRLEPAELGFIRVVSYLYAHYFEAGKVGVRFLMDLLPCYDLDESNDCKKHHKLVNDLRTFTQHNLDLKEDHGNEIKANCEAWFARASRTMLPSSEEHWSLCLAGILDEAIAFLTCLVKCIRKIEIDESKSQTLEQWAFKRTRHHPAYQFDRLIELVANDMGRYHLDAVKLRKKHYDKWIQKLTTLSDDYIFEDVARELIEREIIYDARPPMKIDGKCIQNDLGVQPGPKLGKLLDRMYRFIDQNPTSTKEEIYTFLRRHLDE